MHTNKDVEQCLSREPCGTSKCPSGEIYSNMMHSLCMQLLRCIHASFLVMANLHEAP